MQMCDPDKVRTGQTCSEHSRTVYSYQLADSGLMRDASLASQTCRFVSSFSTYETVSNLLTRTAKTHYS